jgi:predicted phage terminase large subunit-like protein
LFAHKFGKKNKEKIEQFGKELFGIELEKGNQSTTDWGINGTRGGMISRGILAGITGEGADLMIIDDPIKNREEANSETYREKLWQEWIDTLSTRLHPGAIVIVILTRWHEDDLQGRLLNKEYAKVLPWNVYNLPLEAEENDLLGRKLGEPLWPERYGYDFINERKNYPNSFNSLYQGRPTALEGNMFKRDAWQYYDKTDAFVNSIPVLALSVDATFTDGTGTDKVSIQVWGKLGANCYKIDNLTTRLNFTATKQAIKNMLQKYPRIGVKYIEAKANGHAIIDVLNREIGGFIPVKADVSTGGKIARAYAVEPFVTSGNVFLPRGEGCQWVHEYVEEMASFPNGAHDDQVDATTQVLNKLIFFFAELEKFAVKPSQHNFVTKQKTSPFEQEYNDDFVNQF